MSKKHVIQWAMLALLLAAGLTRSQVSAAGSDELCNPGRSSDACNVIQGFDGNGVANSATGATIAGGGRLDLTNRVTGNFGTVGGGVDNVAGEHAAVAGGSDNTAAGYRSSIGGGSSNQAITAYSTISGGTNNTTEAIHATIGGGSDNAATGRDTTISGGSGNIAGFTLATVGGGGYNVASSLNATVGGGMRNTASGTYATVSGGSGNHATALDAAVAGGAGNIAGGDDSTIGGGLANRATDKYATVSGGSENLAGNANEDPFDARFATVGGGENNAATGPFSTVPGGSLNQAAGAFSFAAGRRAIVKPDHPGALVLADSNSVDFPSLAPNEFAVRATGGVRLVTGIDAVGNPIAGARIAKGGGAWEVLSDRNAKTDLAPVDGRQVLAQLARLPITTWSYRSEDSSIHHMGPMAQDFAAFGLGEDNQYINTLDANGVALAALQGLYQTVQEKDARIAELEGKNAAQQSRLAGLDKRVAELEHKSDVRASVESFNPALNFLLLPGLFFFGLGLGLGLSRRWPVQNSKE